MIVNTALSPVQANCNLTTTMFIDSKKKLHGRYYITRSFKYKWVCLHNLSFNRLMYCLLTIHEQIFTKSESDTRHKEMY